jgi:hypothetical protein
MPASVVANAITSRRTFAARAKSEKVETLTQHIH